MKKILLILLISLWLAPIYAESFQSECGPPQTFENEKERLNSDIRCFEEQHQRDKEFQSIQKVKELMFYIKSFMIEVNKSHLTEDFAIFLYSMKTELVKAGFTEKQSMIFLSFSGQLLYEESQEE